MNLVAPEIPDAQRNQGPALFLQALGQGLQAMARFAEMKRQSQSEMLQIAARERMAQDEHQLGLQKLELETEMRGREMDINESLLPSRKAYLESVAITRKNATGAALEFNRQRQTLINDVNSQAAQLKLDDPEFATKEPVQFAANVMQFEDMFRLSPLPEVKHAIKQYRTIADQQKLTIKTTDAEGNPIGDPKAVPIWQIVKNLQDSDAKAQTVAMLKANGYYSEKTKKVPGVATKSWARPIDSAWDAIIGPTEKTEIIEEPEPALGQILEKGKGVKFERVPSRVPPTMLPKSAAAGTSPTELPEPDLPRVEDEPQASFTPTETDIKIAHAKAAIAKGAPSEAVAQRLQQMGIDPELLWS